MAETLFTTQAADGDSLTYKHLGGELAIWVWGAFDSGTVTLHIKTPDGTAWVPADNGSWTGNIVKLMKMPPCELMLKLAGTAGGAAAISAQVAGY